MDNVNFGQTVPPGVAPVALRKLRHLYVRRLPRAVTAGLLQALRTSTLCYLMITSTQRDFINDELAPQVIAFVKPSLQSFRSTYLPSEFNITLNTNSVPTRLNLAIRPKAMSSALPVIGPAPLVLMELWPCTFSSSGSLLQGLADTLSTPSAPILTATVHTRSPQDVSPQVLFDFLYHLSILDDLHIHQGDKGVDTIIHSLSSPRTASLGLVEWPCPQLRHLGL